MKCRGGGPAMEERWGRRPAAKQPPERMESPGLEVEVTAGTQPWGGSGVERGRGTWEAGENCCGG